MVVTDKGQHRSTTNDPLSSHLFVHICRYRLLKPITKTILVTKRSGNPLLISTNFPSGSICFVFQAVHLLYQFVNKLSSYMVVIVSSEKEEMVHGFIAALSILGYMRSVSI